MTPERWQQIEKLFHAVLELEGQERSAFLEEACGNDESLRREVESLLGQKEKPEVHERAGGRSGHPPDCGQ